MEWSLLRRSDMGDKIVGGGPDLYLLGMFLIMTVVLESLRDDSDESSGSAASLNRNLDSPLILFLLFQFRRPPPLLLACCFDDDDDGVDDDDDGWLQLLLLLLLLFLLPPPPPPPVLPPAAAVAADSCPAEEDDLELVCAHDLLD